MRSLPVRIRVSRRFALLAVAVSLVGMMSGCAGGGGHPAQPEVVSAYAGFGYDPADGVPAIVPRPPVPDSVEQLLLRRLPG